MSLLAHRSFAAAATRPVPRPRRAPLRVVAFTKDDVPQNVQDARQWISNWKSGSQQTGGKASAEGKQTSGKTSTEGEQQSEQGAGVEATPDGGVLYPASALKDVNQDELLKKMEDKVHKDGSH